MRAGRMKHLITIQEVVSGVDEHGTPVETGVVFYSLRAELVQQSTDEFLKAQGAVGETVVVFRTRYLDGVTVAHRVLFKGEPYNVRQVAPIEGNRGLELRCARLD